MFSHLFALQYKRSGTQAFGFYVAYLAMFIVLGLLVGLLVNPTMGLVGVPVNDTLALTVGTSLATVACLALGLAIVEVKGLLGQFWLLIIAILGGLLAIPGGGFLGLIPVAFLTTVPARKSLSSKK